MAVNPDVLPKGPVGYPWLSRIMTHGCKYVGNQDIKMGTILEARGNNETGKSVFLKLVSRSFKKEHDPDLIAEDYDEAVVRVEFVDEAGVVFHVETTTTPKSTTREVGASDGRVIDRQVETWLGRLTNSYLLDPLSLLDANREKREEFLRAVLPVYFTAEEITAITGVALAKDCDMKEFDAIMAGAEENRSKLNKKKEEIEGSIKRSSFGLLESTDRTNYAVVEEQKREELRTKESWLQGVKSEIEITRLAELKDLEAEMNRKIQEAQDEHRRKSDAAREKAKKEADAAEAKYGPEIKAKSAEVEQAKSKNEEQTRQKGLREHLEKERAALKGAAREAAAAQTVVERLRDLQSAKWRTLPIKGLTYTGGDLYLDGKNIQDMVNTAAIYKTMFLILQHSIKPGMLPLIVSKRTESLDDRNRKWYYDAARASGFQVIAEIVTQKVPEDETIIPLSLGVLD